VFGVAFGNLFLGLPFHFDALQRPIGPGGFFSLLHPFALLSGVVSLSMLILHGASYAAMKVGEPMAARASALGRCASTVYVLAFIGAGVWVATIVSGYHIIGNVDHAGPSDPTRKTVEVLAGDWLTNFRTWPWMWVAPGGAILAAVTAHLLLHLRLAGSAFMASTLVQAGTILTAGFALFPFLMPSSTYPNQSLTIWDASSSPKTLFLMLCAALVFIPIILAYTIWVFRVLKGRSTLEGLHGNEGPY